jgi:hypothetical protein
MKDIPRTTLAIKDTTNAASKLYTVILSSDLHPASIIENRLLKALHWIHVFHKRLKLTCHKEFFYFEQYDINNGQFHSYANSIYHCERDLNVHILFRNLGKVDADIKLTYQLHDEEDWIFHS